MNPHRYDLPTENQINSVINTLCLEENRLKEAAAQKFSPTEKDKGPNATADPQNADNDKQCNEGTQGQKTKENGGFPKGQLPPLSHSTSRQSPDVQDATQTVRAQVEQLKRGSAEPRSEEVDVAGSHGHVETQ